MMAEDDIWTGKGVGVCVWGRTGMGESERRFLARVFLMGFFCVPFYVWVCIVFIRENERKRGEKEVGMV